MATLWYGFNPYKPGSKIAAVFDLLADGDYHPLSEVVPLVNRVFTPVTPATKRTAGSFIRTLRRKFKVRCCPITKDYILEGPKESYYDDAR